VLGLLDPGVGLLGSGVDGSKVEEELTAYMELLDSVTEEEMISGVKLGLLDS